MQNVPIFCSDTNRKRQLIIFDGSSTNSAPLKVKKPEGGGFSSGNTDRLKPPPTANMASPVRKLTTVTSKSSTDMANLKREAHISVRAPLTFLIIIQYSYLHANIFFVVVVLELTRFSYSEEKDPACDLALMLSPHEHLFLDLFPMTDFCNILFFKVLPVFSKTQM